jgi:hypothetical protein
MQIAARATTWRQTSRNQIDIQFKIVRINGGTGQTRDNQMKYYVLIALTLVSSAYADELPKNLLLKCEGKATTLLSGDGMKPEVQEDKFSATLRLKDGELADTTSIWLTMKTCELKNATVHCT